MGKRKETILDTAKTLPKVSINEDPHICYSRAGGTRCDVCFGEILPNGGNGGTGTKTTILVEPHIKDPVSFKYNEQALFDEFYTYLRSTYGQHYVGDNNVQSLDLIFALGKGWDFVTGNALKYLARAGRKEGQIRTDLLKALHYTLLALYELDRKDKKNAKV